jgi:hypothetical protein
MVFLIDNIIIQKPSMYLVTLASYNMEQEIPRSKKQSVLPWGICPVSKPGWYFIPAIAYFTPAVL